MTTINTTSEQTLSDEEVLVAVRQLTQSGGDLLFQNRYNRDAVYKALPQAFKLTARRRSTGHQLLDPRYTFEGSHIPDAGLLNDYRHSFANLYEIAV